MNFLIQFATTSSAAEAETGIMNQLGIDLKMLVLQFIAFMILLLLLKKFVFPTFISIVDQRQKQIEDSRKMAEEAKEQAQSTEQEVAQLIKQARAEASEIVATAKSEADATLTQAEQKAKDRAELIVQQAHDDIQKDIAKARSALATETLELVALATEKVVGNEVAGKLGDDVIKRAVSEAKS